MSESFFKLKNGGLVNHPAFEQIVSLIPSKFSFVSFSYQTFFVRKGMLTKWMVGDKQEGVCHGKNIWRHEKMLALLPRCLHRPPPEFPFPIIPALTDLFSYFFFLSRTQGRGLYSSRLKFPWGFWIINFNSSGLCCFSGWIYMDEICVIHVDYKQIWKKSFLKGRNKEN